MKIDIFQETIKNIFQNNGEALKTRSENSKVSWNVRNEWWNTKFYKNNPPNDGEDLQEPYEGKREKPYYRRLFKKSCARFA